MKIKRIFFLAMLLAPMAFVRPSAAQDLPLYWDGGIVADADIFVWQDTIAFFDGNFEDLTTPEGHENFQVSTISWAGWGLFDQVGTYDFSAMSGFNLDFWVRADIDLTVEMQDATNGANGFPISSYGWDGTYTWQRITIPVTDFGRDLTQLESPFMITAPDAAVFYVDGVRWQDPLATNVTPVIDSFAVTTALSNRPYKYDVNASDTNFDRLTYSLASAPAGMTIDPLSGNINWNPVTADEGVHNISVAVNDGMGGVVNDNYTLNVVPSISPSEYLLVTGTFTVDFGTLYNEWGTGSTTIGTGFVTRVSTSFAGWGFIFAPFDLSEAAPMSIFFIVESTADLVVGIDDTTSNKTVRISEYGWDGTTTPQRIIIPVVDFGADLANLTSSWNVTMETTGTFTISDLFWRVPNVVNGPPMITSVPVTTVGAPATYVYDVDATDPDGDNLTYNLIVAPTNMGIDPNSGLILWLTELSDVGSHPVTVQVSDGNGNFDQQSFTVDVQNSSTLYGDANEDGLVTSIDASQAARHSVGLITLSAQGQINAEVSGDGNITSIDASQIARFSVGLITCFPVEPSCP